MRRRYFDPIQIPPLPRGIILTDRDDGTLWLVSQDTDASAPDDNGRIMLTDTIPRNISTQTQTYAAYEEPWLDSDPTVRLIVRGGRLGIEKDVSIAHGVTDRDQAPLYTRYGSEHKTRRIYIPDSFVSLRFVLAWEPLDL